MAETKKTTTRKKAGTSVSAKSPSASARKKKTTTTKKKTAGRPRKKRKSGGDLFSDFFSMKNISKQTEKTFRKMLPMLVGAIFCFILAVGGAIFLYVKYVNPYAFKLHPVTHPKGYTVYGVDVARYQGDIDWERLSMAKIDGHEVTFVIAKATEGADHSDPYFETNFVQSRKNGFVRGAYHFFTPGTVPYFQIQNFVRTVGNLEEGDLPPILDVEKADGISKAQLQEDVLKWLVEIERIYKVRPILYTGVNFKRKYLDRSEFDEYPLWIANYADSLSYDGEWEFWQYSDAGKVDGISEYVDLDVYHTTLENFESLLIHK